MKLASLSEIQQICEYIQTNQPRLKTKYYVVYIDIHADMREPGDKIFSVTLRGLFAYNFRKGINDLFKDSSNAIPYESLFEWVMAFLKGDWEPNEYHLEVMRLKLD